MSEPRPMTGEAVEDVTNAMQRAFGWPTDKGWGAVVLYAHVTSDPGLFMEGFTYPYPMTRDELHHLIENCRIYLDEMERRADA